MALLNAISSWRDRFKLHGKLPAIAMFVAVNEWFTGYAIGAVGVAGSWLTFLYFGAGLWAIASLALGRYPIDIPYAARPFVLACLFFAFVMIGTSYYASGRAGAVLALGQNAALLFVGLLISRYKYSLPHLSVVKLIDYAGVGALLGCALGLLQVFWSGEDASGGAGNASVFGFVMAILAVLSLANLSDERTSRKWLAIMGFSAAMIGILLSQTRTLYPLVLILPVTYILFHYKSSVKITSSQLIVAALLLGGTGVYFGPKVAAQYSLAKTEIDMAQDGDNQSSIGVRIALWAASFAAIEVQPVTGYGQLKKMEAVRKYLPDNLKYFGATHVHNAYIDSTVAGGVFAGLGFLGILFTPLLLLRRGSGSVPTDVYRYSVVGICCAGALNSTMNLLFTQDLMTVIFLFPLVVLAANSTP